MARPHQPTPDWLRPLPVRLAVVLAPAAWAGFEAWLGNTEWAVMVGAAAAWGVWTLLARFEPGPKA